jgi:hypothetical protein
MKIWLCILYCMQSCCAKLFHCKILLCLRKERLHIPTLFVDLLSTPAFLVPTPVSCSRIPGVITEYLCHKWPRVCFAWRNHSVVLSSFITVHWVCNKSNAMCANRGAGTAAISTCFWWESCCSIFIFFSFGSILYMIVCSFGHCIVCPSIYRFWLPFWYLLNSLTTNILIQLCIRYWRYIKTYLLTIV